MTDLAAELLFVYGELRNPALQLDVFGRVPATRPALLRGYAVEQVHLRHPLDDGSHPALLPHLRATGGALDRVVGAVLLLTWAELEAIDELAAPAYRRVRVDLVAAAPGWAFVRA